MASRRVWIFFIACIVFLIFSIAKAVVYRISVTRSEFHGIIQKIVFNEKDFATVLIDNVKYELMPSGSRIRTRVETGDEIFKTKGKPYYLIKKKDGKILILDY